MTGQSAASPEDAGDAPKKSRRTEDTIEPITWHGTSDHAWDEILNIAGANNPLPKLVCELVATEDTLAFKCLQKKLPYLGICFTEYHRNLLRTRLAQRVFQSMMEDDSPFGSPESRSALQKIWANEDNTDGDPEGSGDDPEKKQKKATLGKVDLKRRKRQSAGKGNGKADPKKKPKPDASKRQAMLDKLNGDDGEGEEGEEGDEEGEEEEEEEAE